NLGAMIPYPPARPFMLEEIPRGLFVQLLTPGKTIFVWAPITLLTLLSLRDAWRVDRGIVAGLPTAAVAALLFYAAFLFPDGGYSHGPRHLLPLVPLALLPLASARIALPRRAVIACAAAGSGVAAGGAAGVFSQ